MDSMRRQQGAALLAAAAMLATVLLAVAALGLASQAGEASRAGASDRALLQAREALAAYAADRAIDADFGPGYLPCPDLDDDGWAESTCGSLSGEVGQRQRLGRLPWKTLGLPDLRDASGERLWYAVSTRHKGLLNCAASPGCLDFTPDTALGTVSVRTADGQWVHDGRLADAALAQHGGAAAVVLAAGAPLVRRDGWVQQRACAAGDCDAAGRCIASPPQRAARCDPRNYLDVVDAGGALEDNAAFHDRSAPASRAGNGDGFAHASRSPHANDRLVAIGYHDLMPRVMGRVAAEALHCLRLYAALPGHGGRVPWATPACGPGTGDAAGFFFGRIPAPPFTATRSSDASLEAEWPPGCALAAGHGWWPRWWPYVFYALAPEAAPRPQACGAGGCLTLEDAHGEVLSRGARVAVIVAGNALARGGMRQDHGRLDAPLEWLEGAHSRPADPCGAAAPPRLTRAARGDAFNDLVRVSP